MFIVFEGPEGCGKSTQARMAEEALGKRSVETVLVREPGSTPLGEKLRGIVLESSDRIDLRAEVLLYMASRAQMIDEIVRPALEAGKVVLSERFLSSTVAYQGAAGGADLKTIECIGSFATDNVRPDLTIVMDVDVREGLKRTGTPDRIERRGEEYHEKVRESFLQMAKKNPDTFVVVDGGGSKEEIHKQVMTAIDEKMK